MYRGFFKRFLDFTLSLMGLMVLSPVLLVLTVLGWIKMKGNPFFTQERPGKDEKIFKLIKFRTMTCRGLSWLEAHAPAACPAGKFPCSSQPPVRM